MQFLTLDSLSHALTRDKAKSPRHCRFHLLKPEYVHHRIKELQPWFIEKSGSHAGGNLVLYSDGQCLPLKEAIRRTPAMP